MMRLIGAILLISGTVAWGMAGVMRLRGRVRSLSALTSALEIMKSEICDRLTPLPELFDMMQTEATPPAGLLFRNAGEKLSELGTRPLPMIWREAVAGTPELLLAPSEELVLLELGLSLGRYDIEEQRRAFSYALRRLDTLTKKAESERDANSKLHAFLGVAAGVFAIIILL
jgi:stage III sporulation protein AB